VKSGVGSRFRSSALSEDSRLSGINSGKMFGLVLLLSSCSSALDATLMITLELIRPLVNEFILVLRKISGRERSAVQPMHTA